MVLFLRALNQLFSKCQAVLHLTWVSSGLIALAFMFMAMAVEGSSRHYVWDTIQTRHWLETAKRCSMEAQMESVIAEVVASVPTVIATVSKLVPRNFPSDVADSILTGVERAARRLRMQ